MFRNILFTMSLSGSIVMVLYILFYPLAQRYFPLVWRYRVLKIAMFFYLIPIAECKYYVLKILKILFSNLWDKIYVEPNFNVAYSVYIEDGFIQLSPNIYKIIFILFSCGIISSLIFSRSVIQNQRVKKLYIAGSCKFTSSEFQEVFLEIQKELNLKKQIKFFWSEYCRSPVTSGIIFPVVWFPDYGEKELDKRAFQYMIKHELLHIKRNDILVKCLGLLVVAIHWFNPFSYFLYHELSSIGEMYCDHGVLEGQGEAERKEYGELLLQSAVRKAPDNRYSLFVGMADKGYQRTMKRRIIEMKIVRKNKIFFSIMMMIFICIAGGFTAFAYESPHKIIGNKDNDFYFDGKFIKEEKTQESIPYEQYFIDVIGTIYEVKELHSSERSDCIHEYKNGTYKIHKKNSNGECTITEYDSQICIFCVSVKIDDKISTTTYKKCPH